MNQPPSTSLFRVRRPPPGAAPDAFVPPAVLVEPRLRYTRFGPETLEDAVEFYREGHPFNDPDLAPEFRRLDMDEDDEGDIEAFLHALTDDFDRQIPATVPSGLTPGGEIDR